MSDELTKVERAWHRQAHFETTCHLMSDYLKSEKLGGWEQMFSLVIESNKLLLEELEQK